jgi:hypothetical protein
METVGVRRKHFIITMFNLQLSWEKDKRSHSTQTEEWLAERFVLFETYCFPSIRKQTNGDFCWLCLFDRDTPPEYVQRMEQYKRECPQFTPCFIAGEDAGNYVHIVQKRIEEMVDAEDEFVITTNVDNDDAIHLQTVEYLHDMIESRAPEAGEVLVSFPYGYQYFAAQEILLKMKYPHNHFLTLIEKNGRNLRTVIAMGHASARKECKAVVDVKTEPFWIEIVHNSNVSNDLRMTSRISYAFVLRTVSLRDFGLNIRLKRGMNLYHLVLRFPALFFKIAFYRLNKKLRKKLAPSVN